jgi:hypothetical protein
MGRCWKNPKGKRPFGRHRCRSNNIKMTLKNTGWEDMDWTDLIQDRDWYHGPVDTVMNFQLS